MEDLISQLQLLHTNILPPYSYDDDEGQRSVEEYREFYSGCLGEAIVAVTEYIERYRQLNQQPNSEKHFADYLVSRQRFIRTLPFCEDELPRASEVDVDSIHEWLRSQFADERNSAACNFVLQKLVEFRDILCSYQTKLG